MVSWHLRPDWATCVYEGCYGHLLRSGVASQVLAGVRLIVCVRAGGCAVRWDGGLQPLQPLQVTRSEERPRRDSERARWARLIPLGLLRGRSRARTAEKQRGGCPERPQDSARARPGRLSGASGPSASPGEGPLELGARLRLERAGAACRGVAQAQGRRVQAAASGACGRSGSRGTSRLCARLEWTGSGARATT